LTRSDCPPTDPPTDAELAAARAKAEAEKKKQEDADRQAAMDRAGGSILAYVVNENAGHVDRSNDQTGSGKNTGSYTCVVLSTPSKADGSDGSDAGDSEVQSTGNDGFYGAGKPAKGNFKNTTDTDCALAMLQWVERLAGKTVRSRAELIRLMGVTEKQFDNKRSGGKGLPLNHDKATTMINKVLAADKLKANPATVQSYDDYARLAKGGDVLILGSSISWVDPVEGVQLRNQHVVAAQGRGGDNPLVDIYNATGKGDRLTLSSSEAMQRDYPMNTDGVSYTVWTVNPL
jgi:hypothetical protein